MVNERVQEAERIKDECERDLSVAKPKLAKATKALDTLDQNDINNIKAMLKPPNTVRLVMEAVCVLCRIPPLPIPNPKSPKERILDYWEASKKFLSDKAFLTRLKDYDKDNIDAALMKRIRDVYVSQSKDFNPERVEKASSAARGLCEWILALNEYEKVLTVVRPKQTRYNESKADVERL
jgi:dynein heavy chain